MVIRSHPSSSGEKIRIFIGTELKTEIARKVLQFSIDKRTEAECCFTPMIGPDWEYDTAGFTQGTGFSLRRWMIPAFCNFQGRAIYLDADQIVFSDIWELWTRPENPVKFADKDVRPARPDCSAWMTWQNDKYYPNQVAPQSSVMVIDCAAAKAQWGWHIKEVLANLRAEPSRANYVRFMHCEWMKPAPCRIETGWNHLNEYDMSKTKLLHYTKEPEQPWYNPEHKHAMHWKRELMSAIGVGIVSPAEIWEAIEKWNVKEDWRNTNGLHPDYASFGDPKLEEKIRRDRERAEKQARKIDKRVAQ